MIKPENKRKIIIKESKYKIEERRDLKVNENTMEWTLVTLLLLDIWGKKEGSTSTIRESYTELYIQTSTLEILNEQS